MTFEDELRELIHKHLAANSGNVGAFLRVMAALEDAKGQLEVDLHVMFTDEQWRDFHKEDKRAGGAVVTLMLGIFIIGVVLYSIVNITL